MAVNIFDELHSATTEGIVADDSQIRHGSNSTVSAELENKMDFPSGGSDGQVLTLYKHSPAWKDAQGGSSSADKVTFDPSDTSLEGETVQVAVSELANGVALCSEDPSDDGTIDSQLQRHTTDGLHDINPKTKAANVSFEDTENIGAATTQEALTKISRKVYSLPNTSDDDSAADFNIGDDNGNVLVQFKDGHIKTKNFDSRYYATESIPEYWETYMSSKVDEINSNLKAIGRNCTSFVFITDTHWDSNYKKSPSLIKYIVNNTNVNQVIFGGDAICEYSTKEDAIRQLTEFKSAFYGLNMINMVGNHDFNTNNQTDWTQEISEGEFYDIMERDIESLYNFETSANYGYKDNESQKTRYIFIDSGFPEEGQENVDVWEISQTQIDWMANKINELEEDWTAIIFTHIAYFYNWNWDGATKNTFTRHPILLQIINAIDGIYDTCDAKIAGIIAGHGHFSNIDSDTQFYTTKGYPIIITTCDAHLPETKYTDDDAQTRTEGTTTEQAFDVFFIDRDNKKISTIRIGAGNNRNFTY